jgi:hypothetical protein
MAIPHFFSTESLLLLMRQTKVTISHIFDQITDASRLATGKHTEEKTFRYVNKIGSDEYYDQVQDLLCKRGYVFVKESGILLSEDKTHVVANILLDNRVKTLSVFVRGDENEITEMGRLLDDSLEPIGPPIRVVENIDADGRFTTSVSYIDKATAKLASQSFYPWLSVSLDEYFTAFMEAEESVLVMIGPPGTGKSTFLRSMLASGYYPAILAYAPAVVASPLLLNEFLRFGDQRVLVYEDMDNYLKSREEGNRLMSSILNSAQGIVQHPGRKIVISTNLDDITTIDPALLRVGRCFDILKFRYLTSNEAMAVRQDLKLEPFDFTDKSEWSLAEVLRTKNGVQQTVNRFGKRKIGFGT